MGTDAREGMNAGSLSIHGFREDAASARQAWLDVGDIRPGRIYTPDVVSPAIDGRVRLGERLRIAGVWSTLRRTHAK